MITVTIDFKDAPKFEHLIRYIEDNLIYAEAQEGVRVLGHHTADFMRKVIVESKKRPDKGTHKLENAILSETISTVGGVEVGIGRIATLIQEAPYFEVLNSGGYIPNHGNFVPLGAFVPGEPIPNSNNFRDGQWQVGQGKYTFKAKRPIEGIDYIGKAIRNLDEELKTMIEKLGSKWIDGMSKA